MDSGSSSSSGEEEDAPKIEQLGFSKDLRFRNHGAALPDVLEKAASVLADTYEFTDLFVICWFETLRSPAMRVNVNCKPKDGDSQPSREVCPWSR